MSFWEGFNKLLFGENKSSTKQQEQYDKVANYAMVKIRTATFVSVMLSTNRIIELGLPLKEFFIWGDDVEYTERISSLYPSYVACRSIVIHKRYLQKALIFDEETDLHRLNNYFYVS